MVKKVLLTAAACSLVASMTFAAANQSALNSVNKRSDYVFTSHHVGEIPKQFVGTYMHGKSHSEKAYVKFTLGSQGTVNGLFARGGKLIEWTGSVVAVGSNMAGQKKLAVHYTVDRKKFGGMSEPVKRTIDSPGQMYITMASDNTATRMVDIIGHYENYVALNQVYTFKK